MTDRDRDRIQSAIRHIQTAVDVDPWAVEIAVAAMREKLSREPSEDAVSRKAVSEWLKQYGQDVLHGKYKFSLMYIWKNLMDLPSAQPQYEELTPEEAASEIASGSTMSAWYWLDDMIRLKQMGYAICRKKG